MKKTVMMLSMSLLTSLLAAEDIIKNFNDEWDGAKKLEIEKIDGKEVITIEGDERIFSKKFYPAALGKTYTLSGNFRSLGKNPSRLFFGFDCYDKNKKYIYPENSNIITDSETVLVKDCKIGDKEIYIKSNSKWRKNCYVAFNVKKDYSDLPNFSTRLKVKKIETEDDMMKLVLSSALHKAYSVGTKIRAHVNTFGPHVYTVRRGAGIPFGKWQLCKDSAQLAAPGQAGWKYLQTGTAYFKILILVNYGKKKDEKLALMDIKLEIE